MEQLVPWSASERLPSISSFSASGRITGALGEVPNGLEGVDQAVLEVQVMSQAMVIEKSAVQSWRK